MRPIRAVLRSRVPTRPQVWLIVEIHCSPPIQNLQSVWISGRPLSDDLNLEEDVAVKIIGPTSTTEADRVVQVLLEQLELAGVEVHVSSAADD
jgi:hypothetical protein